MPEKKKPLFNAGPTEKKSTEITKIGRNQLNKELETVHEFGSKSFLGPIHKTPKDRQDERDEEEKTSSGRERGRDIRLPSKNKSSFKVGPTAKKSTELTSVDGKKLGKDLSTFLPDTQGIGNKHYIGYGLKESPESRQHDRDEVRKIMPGKYRESGDIDLDAKKKKRR